MPGRKSELGQYITFKNPFISCQPFADWVERVAHRGPILEPFAGAGHIIAMLGGTLRDWAAFDVEPQCAGIVSRDTFESWPTLPSGAPFQVCITNPPWLSRWAASAKGLRYPNTNHPNIYMLALEYCLRADYLAILLPQSSLKRAGQYPRLEDVVVIGSGSFEDTEEPTLLALFGPSEQEDFDLWSEDQYLGRGRDLLRHNITARTNVRGLITFNHPMGQVGLFAVDSRRSQKVRFVRCSAMSNDIKRSSRFMTKIYMESLPYDQVDQLIAYAKPCWRT
jgi:hypothetical protein